VREGRYRKGDTGAH